MEIDGRRRLAVVGSGRPGTAVLVRLQSRKAGDGNKPYALAASLGRRPGLRLPGGERVDLAPDALFFASARGLLPAIFQNFQGRTDAQGNALARVNIPREVPAGRKVTVFVAGVVYDQAGVRSVTNSHWFVLD